MSKKIGFIGLGIMGKPMSKNLIKAGYDLTVCDINAAAVAEVVALGAKSAATPKDVAAVTDIIITMLPNSPQVKTVVLGANGVIEGARTGALVVDMSSIAPLAAQEVAKALAEKGLGREEESRKTLEALKALDVYGTPLRFFEMLNIL